MNKKYLIYAALILAGYMLHDQIAKLPFVSKLPTV
jgi:hypothetical protein